MKLRRRQKRKSAQALDALASVTKAWSEWQLGKRASKGVAKAKELRPPSKPKRALASKWVKVAGAVAVAGGTAAAIGRKLKGDEPEIYAGPPPSVAAEAAVPSPDAPAPLAVAPDPATQERDTEPAAGASALRANREEPAAVPSAEEPPSAPAVAEEPAAEAPEEPTAAEPAEEEPTAAEPAEEEPVPEEPTAGEAADEPATADSTEPAEAADDEPSEPVAATDDAAASDAADDASETNRYITINPRAAARRDEPAFDDE